MMANVAPPSGQRPLTLRHFVNLHSANVGNGALTEGTERVLSDDLGRQIVWMRDAWDDYSFGIKPFDGRFVELINRYSDGMIVGGAVALNGRQFYANAGMRFDLPRELWSEIRRPVVFYGISHRHWSGQTYHHIDKLRWALDAILGRDNVLLGFRNDGTREWLAASFGIESDRFDVVPDPAVFTPYEGNGQFPELDPSRGNVILAFNDEDSRERYVTAERRMTVINGIAAAVERMLTKWDVNVVLAPHYFDDCRMIADFVDACKPRLAHRCMIATGLSGIHGCRQFYGRYKRADLVIAMRVHSMSPCVGLGVPMIPLVTQDRMSAFLEDVGLSELMVDAFAADLADRLEAMIDRVLANPDDIRRRFGTACKDLRDRTRRFNAKIRKLFDAR